jgi:hypothetical protein
MRLPIVTDRPRRPASSVSAAMAACSALAEPAAAY